MKNKQIKRVPRFEPPRKPSRLEGAVQNRGITKRRRPKKKPTP